MNMKHLPAPPVDYVGAHYDVILQSLANRLERQETLYAMINNDLAQLTREFNALKRASRNVTPDEKRRLILDRKKLAQREYRQRLKEKAGG